MELDQQKLQKLIQHNLICTAIIFISYISYLLVSFFQISRQQKKKHTSIDDRNVSKEPLMHHEDLK